MNIDHQGDEPHLERLDADAVCIQCGTVNEEGTLLCKVCGNNLRDQRNSRMTADQVLELERSGPRHQAWASAVAFVMGVGVIVFTLYNQDLIVNWLMGVQAGVERGPADMWLGHEGETIDALVADLERDLPTEEIAQEARLNVAASNVLDGTYVLFVGDVFVGSANVVSEGDNIFFGALLESGEELRGMATLQGDYYIMAPESGGMNARGRMVPIRGVASPQGGGIIECMGDDTRTRYSCLAYKLAS